MTNTQEVLKKAEELAQLIKDSNVFASYEKAKAASDADEGLQQLIAQFNVKRAVVANEMDKEEPDEALIKTVNDDMRKTYDDIMANENMKFYNIRKSYVDQLLNAVNETIMTAITGQAPQSCTHDCSTCHGCG